MSLDTPIPALHSANLPDGFPGSDPEREPHARARALLERTPPGAPMTKSSAVADGRRGPRRAAGKVAFGGAVARALSPEPKKSRGGALARGSGAVGPVGGRRERVAWGLLRPSTSPRRRGAFCRALARGCGIAPCIDRLAAARRGSFPRIHASVLGPASRDSGGSRRPQDGSGGVPDPCTPPSGRLCKHGDSRHFSPRRLPTHFLVSVSDEES